MSYLLFYLFNIIRPSVKTQIPWICMNYLQLDVKLPTITPLETWFKKESIVSLTTCINYLTNNKFRFIIVTCEVLNLYETMSAMTFLLVNQFSVCCGINAGFISNVTACVCTEWFNCTLQPSQVWIYSLF